MDAGTRVDVVQPLNELPVTQWLFATDQRNDGGVQAPFEALDALDLLFDLFGFLAGFFD